MKSDTWIKTLMEFQLATELNLNVETHLSFSRNEVERHVSDD